jgi:hypothetical protein
VACGQPLGGLPRYLLNSLEISRGYNDAMAISARSGLPMVPYVLASIGLGCAIALRLVHRRAWAELLPALGVAGLLFLAFKASFVRRDGVHELIAAVALPFVVATYAFAVGSLAGHPARVGAPRPRPSAGPARLEGVAVGIALALGLALTATHRAAPGFGGTSAVTLFTANVAGALRMAVGRSRHREYHALRLSEIRAQNPLGAIRGRVDVLPYQQSELLAHGLSYAPRPVIQSYSAYTPRLAELNARHFRGPGAPDHVLLGPGTIDDRYPSLDDGPARLELLRSYDPVGMRGDFLLLQRRASPRPVRLTPRATYDLDLASPAATTLPPRGAVWATIELRPTLLGRVRSLLHRAPDVQAKVRTDQGKERTFRIVPEMTRAGFLLSPLAERPADFGALAAGTPAAEASGPGHALPHVTSIEVQVFSGRPALFYERTARMTLYELAAAPAGGGAAPSPGDAAGAERGCRPEDRPAACRQVARMHGGIGASGRATHATHRTARTIALSGR